MQPRQAGYLLMADIEEAESGDVGKVRQWLSKAVRAQRDPAWVADGVVSQNWGPVSPVTGRIDAFEWKVPVEMATPLIDQEEALVLPAPAIDDDPAEFAETELIEEVPPKAGFATSEPEADDTNREGASEAPDKTEEAALRMPDDPGVDPDAKKPASRFKLF